ncbi:unnamed protein product [Adineta ricciae]|uniref:F-box domain-containing protein n=1 Tax=Adineta ricciae TaxID=249248 RepID=A0A814H7K5_ADIRI|nr:unnamed protein product [Adineta ricciae]
MNVKRRLEELPNEILHELFEYFDIYELYKIFSKLNSRFDGLLKSFPHLQLILHSSDDFDHPVHRYLLLSIKTLVINHSKDLCNSSIIQSLSHIRCLILCQPTRQQWNAIIPEDFPHLERLYLINSRFAYRTEQLCQLIFSNSFPSLCSCSLPHISYEPENLWTKSYRLRSLQASIWDIRVYMQILYTCPNLSHLKISLGGAAQTDDFPFDSNTFSHSALQNLVFHHSKPITCQFMDSLLSCTPNLDHFSFRVDHYRPSHVSVNDLAHILQHRVPKLRSIRFDMVVPHNLAYSDEMQTKHQLFRSLKVQMEVDQLTRSRLLIREWNKKMNVRMSLWQCWWYPFFLTSRFIHAQNPFNIGGSSGFLVDPFLEPTGAITTPVIPKSAQPDLSCVSQGALAGAIIGTMLLSAFIAFLTWMIYLRQKLQELQSYENQERKHMRTSSKPHSSTSVYSNYKKQHLNDIVNNDSQLPLDVTDYKFGTFPFRQSQNSSVNGQYNSLDWLTRVPASFRSATIDKDAQMIDVELLNPTFCGLNFSITGNMRAGIFIKDILDKEIDKGKIKLNSSDQLKAGDRIIALTVCFDSIVYEDALTILSYASPYPVILRVQRSTRPTKVKVIKEKRTVHSTTTGKVKWRDDFEHYDNDTSQNHSSNPLNPTLTTDTKTTSENTQHRSSSKKTRSNRSPSTTKINRAKTSANMTAVSEKHSSVDTKKHRNKVSNAAISSPTGISGKSIEKLTATPMPTNKTTVKSVTNAVISYLQYRGANGGHGTDVTNNSEATLMPYYDSPYGYYAANATCRGNLNRNNNNSLSTESLTAVTSLCTSEFSPRKIRFSRRHEQRLSSPARILPITIHTVDDMEKSAKNVDTFV